MNTALWIIASALALAYAAAGTSLLALPREKYRALSSTQHWVDDFDDHHLKIIGTIKLIGALGLVLPAIGGIAPTLVPIAACGMALFMAGAGTTRFRRNEWGAMAGDLLFIALFAFLAWGRFDLAPLA